MQRRPKEGWSPDVQNEQGNLVQEVRRLRHERDEQRKKQHTLLERTRTLLGKGTAETSANLLDQQARDHLHTGKERLANEKDIESIEGIIKEVEDIYEEWDKGPRDEHTKEIAQIIELSREGVGRWSQNPEYFPKILHMLNRAFLVASYWSARGGIPDDIQKREDDIRAYCLNWIQDNIGAIEQTLRDESVEKIDGEIATEGLLALSYVLNKNDNATHKQNAERTLANNADVLLRQGLRVTNGKINNRLTHITADLISKGEGGNFDQVIQAIKTFVEERHPDAGKILTAIDSGMYNTAERREQYRKCVIETFDLDPNDILTAWEDSNYEEHTSTTTYAHWRTLCDIEHQKAGAAKFLVENFNIRGFGRYPPELLVRQVDEYDNVDMPYGIIMYPRADHSGSFTNAKKFKPMAETLKDKYAIRIIEVQSLPEAAEMLMRLDQKYGGHQKIAFAVIGGHGSEETVALGKSDFHGEVIYTSDLSGSEFKAARTFFRDDAVIVLQSCSTGVEEGIAQRLSYIWEMQVTAPVQDTMGGGVIMVTVSPDGSSLDLRQVSIEKGSKFNTFKNGKIISSYSSDDLRN